MILVGILCLFLVAATILIHYEVLRNLNARLPRIAVPQRAKLLVVISSAFLAHAIEITLYALAVYFVVRLVDQASFVNIAHLSVNSALYFSAETFTSLGYGDMVPDGDLRLLAGVEALNGLLLVGWSISYTYFAMERYWINDQPEGARRRHPPRNLTDPS
jgi:voltage-gated potassium channel Kch